MLKITNELMQQIKTAITGQQLQPCLVQVATKCDPCSGTCQNGCNSTCTSNCRSGNGGSSSSW